MDKLEKAVERLRMGSEASLKRDGRPIVITYSGGKDSDACIEVAKIAGVPFEVVHSHTTADAPETVRHVVTKFHEIESFVATKCSIHYPVYKGKRTSMWDLIVQKKAPPTRMQRYCCSVLKESSVDGRFIVTGVRWDESLRRKETRGIAETAGRNLSERIMVSNDNDLSRRQVEFCQLKGQMIFNPIIDWTTDEVWDFLMDRKVKMNPLYSCPQDRVGCIGCPLATTRKRVAEFRRWPAYKRLYIHAFDRMVEARKAAGKEEFRQAPWNTGYDVFRWWMGDTGDQIQFDWYEQEDNNG